LCNKQQAAIGNKQQAAIIENGIPLATEINMAAYGKTRLVALDSTKSKMAAMKVY
jgi:hypothetical protein